MTPLLYAVLKKYKKVAATIIEASKQKSIEKIIIQAANKVQA